MAYSSIVKPSVHFNTKLWTGTGSSNALTGVGFQPDWVWIKNRAAANSHVLQDAVRGVGNTLVSNTTAAESAEGAGDLTAFGSDGFTVGTNGRVNGSGNSMVAWNWKANGAGSANTAGSINSTVSVNTTAGFSIVKFSNGGGGATVGHGLGVVPKMIIVKRLEDSGYDWVVYHKNDTNGLYLNSNGYNNDSSSNSIWFDGVAPTSSVFTCGGDGRMTGSGKNFIAYCFAEKKGYSKFGSYVGNDNNDGTFVYLGFKPAFVMIKKTNEANDWFLQDNKRLGYNAVNYYLEANENLAEQSNSDIDLVSNGFKCRSTGGGHNDGNYIYMAFAEEPLVANSGTDGVPATAR